MTPSPLGVPVGKAKITLNLDEQLTKTAKIAAIDRDQSLGELVEDALRVLLALDALGAVLLRKR